MIKSKIIELFNLEQYDELCDFVKDFNSQELADELSKIDKILLAKILPKIPADISAECFLKFNNELQRYLVDNISEISFDEISEEILETNDVEDMVKQDIFNDIILQTSTDARHEKLLEIIDNIQNKKFSSLKPILAEMEPIVIPSARIISSNFLIVYFRL